MTWVFKSIFHADEEKGKLIHWCNASIHTEILQSINLTGEEAEKFSHVVNPAGKKWLENRGLSSGKVNGKQLWAGWPNYSWAERQVCVIVLIAAEHTGVQSVSESVSDVDERGWMKGLRSGMQTVTLSLRWPSMLHFFGHSFDIIAGIHHTVLETRMWKPRIQWSVPLVLLYFSVCVSCFWVPTCKPWHQFHFRLCLYRQSIHRRQFAHSRS